MLWFAMTHHVFSEPRPLVAHIVISRALAEDQDTQDYVGFSYHEISQSLVAGVGAMVKSDGTDRTGYLLAFPNSAGSQWEDHSRDPEQARRFAGSTMAFRSADEVSLSRVSSGFDWMAWERSQCWR